MPRTSSPRRGPMAPSVVRPEEAVALVRALSPARQALVRLVGLCQYLDRPEVQWLLGVHQSSAHRALQELKAQGLVAEVPQRWHWQLGETRKPHAWFLGPNGAKAFRRLWPQRKLHWDQRTAGSHWLLAHTLRVNEVLVRALQAAADATNILAGAGWLREWEVSFRLASGVWFRPDAYLLLRFAREPRSCGCPYEGEVPFYRAAGPSGSRWEREPPNFPGWLADRAFFVEADTGSEEPSDVLRKAHVYRQAAAALPQSPCPVPAFGSVLLVTTELARAQDIVRQAWRDRWGGEYVGWSEFEDYGGWWVATTTWADLAAHGLLGPIWWTRQRPAPTDLLTLTRLRP